MVALPFLVMVIALALGIPIAFCLGVAGALGILLTTGWNWSTLFGILSMAPFSSVADFSFTTIPMFVLMAYFSAASGLARDLFKATASWLSHLRGGIGIATVFSCGMFGAMCGSSVAAASVFSETALPEMRRRGYSEELVSGTVGVGATLDILMPLSIPMVIYGIVTQNSIGKLLMAGIVPGIIVGIFLAAIVYVWAAIRPKDAPRTPPVPWAQRWLSLRPVWASLLLIAIVMTFLYGGFCTPSEIAALGALAAGSIGVFSGRLKRAGIWEALKTTVRTAAMIFMILIGANIFGYYMALSRIPQHVVETVTIMHLSRLMVIIGIAVVYFVISMFMDEIPLMLLILQLTYPLVISMGFDPIWYGVFMVMLICMGLVFPPVAVVAIVVSATAKINILKVYTGCCIMVIAIIMGTIILIIFPETATWLPSTMR
jgi:tripartite ATP-independent transporter DctM subunit